MNVDIVSMATDFDRFAQEFRTVSLPPIPIRPVTQYKKKKKIVYGDLVIIEFQRDIPKHFENGTDKECIGYGILDSYINKKRSKGNKGFTNTYKTDMKSEGLVLDGHGRDHTDTKDDQVHGGNEMPQDGKDLIERTHNHGMHSLERNTQVHKKEKLAESKKALDSKRIIEQIMADARARAKFQTDLEVDDFSDEERDFFPLQPVKIEVPVIIKTHKFKKEKSKAFAIEQKVEVTPILEEPVKLQEESTFEKFDALNMHKLTDFEPIVEERPSISKKVLKAPKEIEKPVIEFLRTFNRLKAKEMAEKAKTLINNMAKKKKAKQSTDINKFEQIQKCLKDYSRNGNVVDFREKLRSLMDPGLGIDAILGEEFGLLAKAIPNLGKPLPKFPVDKSNTEDIKGFTVYDINNKPTYVKMPEKYRRLSSSMIVPHQTLVPVGKRKSTITEIAIQEEEQSPLLEFKFFKELAVLLDRQLFLDSAAMAILGNRTDDIHINEIKYYTVEEGVELLWNEFYHLKMVQERIVPQNFADEIYSLLHDNPFDAHEATAKIKKLVDGLFHKYAIYLKAFSGHLKRIVGACKGMNPNAISVVAKLFGNLIFRTVLPVTGDKYQPFEVVIIEPANPTQWDSSEHINRDSLRASNQDPRRRSCAQSSVASRNGRLSLFVSGRKGSFVDEKRESVDEVKPLPIAKAEEPHNVDRPNVRLQRDKTKFKSFRDAKQASVHPSVSKKLPSTRTKYNILYELPFLPPGKEPSEFNNEERKKFGWDDITKGDIRLAFDQEIVHCPYSKALEIILIHWDKMFQ